MKEWTDNIKECIRDFTSVMGEVCRKVGLLQDSTDLMKERVEAIDRDIEKLKAKSNNKSLLSFDSLSELEGAMEDFSIGQFRISLKGLDTFTLYVGDEGVIIEYPEFVDIGIPFETCVYMRQSYWNIINKLWQDKKISTE